MEMGGSYHRSEHRFSDCGMILSRADEIKGELKGCVTGIMTRPLETRRDVGCLLRNLFGGGLGERQEGLRF